MTHQFRFSVGTSMIMHALVWLIGLLAAGNMFFLKKLLDKFDSTEAIVWQLRQEVGVLHAVTDNLSKGLGK